MANINQKNAPGVYTQIIDKSLSSTTTARFRPGLIGVASKGPFDTPTTIATVQDFIANFGQPIPGYSFLATAVGVLAPYTNGSVVVRVGGQYQDLPVVGFTGTASGTQGANYFVTNVPQLLNPANTATGNLFVSLSEPGQLNTVNAMVASWNSSGTIELGSVAYASTYNTPGQTDYIADPEAVSPVLNASYTNATIQTSAWPNAASDAQALLLGYTYTDITEYAGLVSGSKNDFYFTVTQDPTVNPYLVPGNLVRISSYEGTRYVTEEALVSGVTPLVNNGNAVILLQATDDTARGYQAVPLQDNYANAKLEVVSGMTPAFLLSALTAGSWANTTVGNPTTGLQVKVGPGTQPGTKKLSIYSDGALVEVYDNLGYPPTNTFTDTPVKLAGILDYEATINTNAPSQNITITAFGYGTNAANTLAPWQSSPAVPIINGYSPLHTDALTGGPANVVNDAATDQIKGGYFADGFSGENAQASDFVGGYQPVTDTMTGLKAFEDTNNITITALCAPGITDAASGVSLPVHTQLRDTAIATKSIALIDVPPFFTDESVTLNPLTTGTLPLTGWNAIDWCNGQGPLSAGACSTRPTWRPSGTGSPCRTRLPSRPSWRPPPSASWSAWPRPGSPTSRGMQRPAIIAASSPRRRACSSRQFRPTSWRPCSRRATASIPSSRATASSWSMASRPCCASRRATPTSSPRFTTSSWSSTCSRASRRSAGATCSSPTTRRCWARSTWR